MNWVKGYALVTCLATPLSLIVETNAIAAPAADRSVSASSDTLIQKDALIQKTAVTDDEKKAKAADCSKQADAKKLHGEARRKFRSTCKKA